MYASGSDQDAQDFDDGNHDGEHWENMNHG